MITTSFRGFGVSFTTLLFLLSMPASAQVLDSRALADARELLQTGRQEIVREELRLTDSESSAFWPIYDQYRLGVKQVRDRQVEMISGYMKVYDAGELNDKFAVSLVDDHFAIANDLLKVQKKYRRKFLRVLPAVKVARFYQLENKMDAEIDIQLAEVIPLLETF